MSEYSNLDADGVEAYIADLMNHQARPSTTTGERGDKLVCIDGPQRGQQYANTTGGLLEFPLRSAGLTIRIGDLGRDNIPTVRYSVAKIGWFDGTRYERVWRLDPPETGGHEHVSMRWAQEWFSSTPARQAFMAREAWLRRDQWRPPQEHRRNVFASITVPIDAQNAAAAFGLPATGFAANALREAAEQQRREAMTVSEDVLHDMPSDFQAVVDDLVRSALRRADEAAIHEMIYGRSSCPACGNTDHFDSECGRGVTRPQHRYQPTSYYDEPIDPNSVSDDSATQSFELERTEFCWRDNCGEPGDPNSETGLCGHHLTEMRSRWTS